MLIDLDKVIEVSNPEAVIAVEGKKYPLSRFSPETLDKFEAMASAKEGETPQQQNDRVLSALRGFFVNHFPPFLSDEYIKAEPAAAIAKATELSRTIGTLAVDALSISAQTERARVEVQRQIECQRKSGE